MLRQAVLLGPQRSIAMSMQLGGSPALLPLLAYLAAVLLHSCMMTDKHQEGEWGGGEGGVGGKSKLAGNCSRRVSEAHQALVCKGLR